MSVGSIHKHSSNSHHIPKVYTALNFGNLTSNVVLKDSVFVRQVCASRGKGFSCFYYLNFSVVLAPKPQISEITLSMEGFCSFHNGSIEKRFLVLRKLVTAHTLEMLFKSIAAMKLKNTPIYKYIAPLPFHSPFNVIIRRNCLFFKVNLKRLQYRIPEDMRQKALDCIWVALLPKKISMSQTNFCTNIFCES